MKRSSWDKRLKLLYACEGGKNVLEKVALLALAENVEIYSFSVFPLHRKSTTKDVCLNFQDHCLGWVACHWSAQLAQIQFSGNNDALDRLK